MVDPIPERVGRERVARVALVAALLLPLLAGWLFFGGGLQALLRLQAGSETTADVGQRAPEFELENLAGAEVHLADYRGQVVLINFWATWCVPCRSEMPALEATYRARRQNGFTVLALNVQETEGDVAPFMRELDLSFPALLDRDAATAHRYLARALPSSFLVDRQGIVRYVRVGPLTQEQLDAELRKVGV